MTDPLPPMIVVAAALRGSDGRWLMQKRSAAGPMGGLWEFPGGKLDPGETPEAALARELHEELGIAIAPSEASPLGFSTGRAAGRTLVLLLYSIECASGEPRALDAEMLGWFTPAEMRHLAMPPADVPFIAILESAAAS